MGRWEEKRLGEFVYINPETLSLAKYDGIIEYLDISSVHEGSIEGYTQYDISDAPSRARRVIKPGDIMYSTVRPNLKAYYFVKNCPNNAICSTGFAVIRNKKNANNRFIYSLISESSFVEYLASVAKGSAYPAVDKNDFLRAKVRIPDIQTQTRIADILSTYDDLIENNNRRIELLEKAAQELYKEWFVRFRFPNHENTKFVNGLPEGWNICKIGTLYNTSSGGTPSRANPQFYVCGKYDWIKTGELYDRFILDTEEKITEEAVKNSSAKIIPENSLILAMYGATIGKMGFTTKQATCNQACCVFKPQKEYGSKYLYFWLLNNREYVISIGFGAAQQNLSQDLIKNIKMLKPTVSTVKLFEERVDPIFTEIKILMEQNQNLKKQRDLLLPRLMSGRLEV